MTKKQAERAMLIMTHVRMFRPVSAYVDRIGTIADLVSEAFGNDVASVVAAMEADATKGGYETAADTWARVAKAL